MNGSRRNCRILPASAPLGDQAQAPNSCRPVGDLKRTLSERLEDEPREAVLIRIEIDGRQLDRHHGRKDRFAPHASLVGERDADQGDLSSSIDCRCEAVPVVNIQRRDGSRHPPPRTHQCISLYRPAMGVRTMRSATEETSGSRNGGRRDLRRDWNARGTTAPPGVRPDCPL